MVKSTDQIDYHKKRKVPMLGHEQIQIKHYGMTEKMKGISKLNNICIELTWVRAVRTRS